MKLQKKPQILTRDFILAFLAQFASSFSFSILIPTLPIYLSGLGCDKIETGILIGVFFFFSLVCRPFVGKALSRNPEKESMIIGSIFYGLASLAYLVAPPFWPFFAVRVFHGLGFGFFHTALLTFIANTSLKAHRGQSLGYSYLSSTISSALAPPIGMFLINHFSFTLLFLLCLGLSLCTLLISKQLGGAQATSLQVTNTEDGGFFNRKAIPASVTHSISLFMWGALAAFFPLYAIDHGVTNPGLFFSAVAVTLILGRSLGGGILDLYSREKVIAPCLVTYIASMVILTFSKTLPMFILVGAIWGIGNAFFMPSIVAYILDREDSSPGPAMGTFTAISDLGLSLGPVIMGIVNHMAGYQVMFICLTLIGIMNLIHFYFLVRKRSD